MMAGQKKASVSLIALFVSLVIILGAAAFLTFNLHGDNSISGAAIWDQTISGGTPVWLLIIILAVLLAFVVSLITYWEYSYTPNKLRRSLKRLMTLVDEGDSEILKRQYLNVYDLYLKLSPKQKQNFYAKITRVREEIEGYLVAENKVSQLFGKADQGDLEEQKTNFDKLYSNYQKLPKKMQQKYYPQIVKLRERLERGI